MNTDGHRSVFICVHLWFRFLRWDLLTTLYSHLRSRLNDVEQSSHISAFDVLRRAKDALEGQADSSNLFEKFVSEPFIPDDRFHGVIQSHAARRCQENAVIQSRACVSRQVFPTRVWSKAQAAPLDALALA